MKLLVCVLSATLLCGCVPYGSSTYGYFSPVRSKVGRSHSPDKIRAGILAVIPLGTPRPDVEQLVRKNFHTPIVPDLVADLTYLRSHPDWSSFVVHLYTYGLAPFGHDDADAEFVFDKQGKLCDVIINAGGTWV